MASARAVSDRTARLDAFERAKKGFFREGISTSRIYVREGQESVGAFLVDAISGVQSAFTYVGATAWSAVPRAGGGRRAVGGRLRRGQAAGLILRRQGAALVLERRRRRARAGAPRATSQSSSSPRPRPGAPPAGCRRRSSAARRCCRAAARAPGRRRGCRASRGPGRSPSEDERGPRAQRRAHRVLQRHPRLRPRARPAPSRSPAPRGAGPTSDDDQRRRVPLGRRGREAVGDDQHEVATAVGPRRRERGRAGGIEPAPQVRALQVGRPDRRPASGRATRGRPARRELGRQAVQVERGPDRVAGGRVGRREVEQLGGGERAAGAARARCGPA